MSICRISTIGNNKNVILPSSLNCKWYTVIEQRTVLYVWPISCKDNSQIIEKHIHPMAMVY